MSTLDVAYVGFGEFGRQIANLVRQVYSPASETFFDDTIYAGARPGALPFGDHCQEQHAQKSFFVCLGYKHAATKRRVLRALLDLGRSVPALVHPTALVSNDVSIASCTTLALGSVVTRSIETPGLCAIGNPLKILDTPLCT